MNDPALSRSVALAHRIPGLQHLLKQAHSPLARVFVPWAVRHPRHLPSLLRLARTREHSKQIRARGQEGGLRVPPFLVLSVTSSCNLRCAGCYAVAVGTTRAPARTGARLALDDWRRLIEESVALGVVGFVIAGGEPFMMPGIARLFRDFPDRLFLVFTNGTALRDADFQALRHCHNTAVVVSLEGDRTLTDRRRGAGVFERAMHSLDRLRDSGVLTGIAVTVGAANVDYWTDEGNIDALMERHTGPLAFFIEEIPAGECAAAAPMTAEQRVRFRATVLAYRSRRKGGAYIIHSPADEEALGGCVSAGRGFAHVNPYGDVTACPVSALATHNVRRSTLADALASPLFSMIRNDGHLLETHGHPCALFANAEKLEEMAMGLGAYRAGEVEMGAGGAGPTRILAPPVTAQADVLLGS
jgi:MoaA/NifB/PqqE/SkfB family radical SAM enzyme